MCVPCAAARYRLCVEESYALGVLGATGRGACEAAGLRPGQVEVIVASMGTTLASVGGFCVGHHEVRGAAAALPPRLSAGPRRAPGMRTASRSLTARR